MLISALANHGLSQELKFPQYNCAIAPPDGWQPMTEAIGQPGLIAAFRNVPKTKLIMVLIDDQNKAPSILDERYVEEFEQGVQASGGGKPKSARFIEVAGVKSYERLGEASIEGQRASILLRAVPADGKIYALQGMRMDGDAGEDSEIRQSLSSFRFITAPSTVTQSPQSPSSAAYRAGYLFGQVIIIALVIAAGFAALRKVTRRKSGPTTPPTLPPP